jgi:hypothetical protein
MTVTNNNICLFILVFLKLFKSIFFFRILEYGNGSLQRMLGNIYVSKTKNFRNNMHNRTLFEAQGS